MTIQTEPPQPGSFLDSVEFEVIGELSDAAIEALASFALSLVIPEPELAVAC